MTASDEYSTRTRTYSALIRLTLYGHKYPLRGSIYARTSIEFIASASLFGIRFRNNYRAVRWQIMMGPVGAVPQPYFQAGTVCVRAHDRISRRSWFAPGIYKIVCQMRWG
jgi:hypothetical protein